MPPPPLASLPGEILILIFKSLDDFPSLAALCQASRVFYDAWRLNACYICQAIVGSDAFEVARLQEIIAKSDRDVLFAVPSPVEFEDQHQKAISDASVLATNDRHVRLAGKLWEEGVTPLCTQWGTRKMIFSGKERIRFQRAYYRFWVLIVSHYASQSVTQRMKAMTLRDLEGVSQVANWLQFGLSCEALVQLDIVTSQTCANTPRGDVDNGYALMSGDWRIVCRKIDDERHNRELELLVDVRDIASSAGFPKDVPLLVWSFFDETQQYVDLIPDV